MGLNFQYYDGLQPKIRAGIINEHECSYLPTVYNSIENFVFSTYINGNFDIIVANINELALSYVLQAY